MSVRPLGSAGEGSRDERPLHTRGRGQPSCCSGASAALGRRETGRALEAGLREDGRQVVRLQGVDEVVDAVRAGRVRSGLRREDGHDDVAVQGILAERELVWRCLEDDRTQQFRWTGRRPNSGGYALAWRQDSDLCLDAKRFSNGDPVIAYQCSRNLLDHQIWATL